MGQRFETLAGLRILVVEDEVLIAMMLENMLEDFGCHVVGSASSIDEALTLVRQHTPDGVLLDMNMEGNKDTHAVAEALRERSVRFLLVTGYDGVDSDPPAIKAAPRLKKPFSQEELARRMEEVFGAPSGGKQTSADDVGGPIHYK